MFVGMKTLLMTCLADMIGEQQQSLKLKKSLNLSQIKGLPV